MTASTEGKSVPEVRARISAARDELTKLMRALVPSPDLRGRVERRIADLGAPAVLGIASGEQLRIIWPGAKQTASGPDERSCEPLAMFALLFPEKLADAAMAEVERMANDPVPRSERPTRIAALEREIDELSHIEEALIEAAIALSKRTGISEFSRACASGALSMMRSIPPSVAFAAGHPCSAP